MPLNETVLKSTPYKIEEKIRMVLSTFIQHNVRMPPQKRQKNKNLQTPKNITLKYVTENFTVIAGLLHKCTIIDCFNMVPIRTCRRIP